MKSFPFIKQLDARDCGPACLAMIAQYYGKIYPIQKLRESSFISRAGVSMLGISDAAEAIEFKTISAKIFYDTLLEIYFPGGVKTSQGKALDLHHGMRGQAEIITENKRLLETLLSPFGSLLKQKSRGV